VYNSMNGLMSSSLNYPTGGDMIDSTRVFNSERTGHDYTYSRS